MVGNVPVKLHDVCPGGEGGIVLGALWGLLHFLYSSFVPGFEIGPLTHWLRAWGFGARLPGLISSFVTY